MSKSTKSLPHLIALSVFIVITGIYFSPALQGDKLQQNDISNWKGMSKEILDFKKKIGEQTLWTNSMFSGMPAYQISTVYPSNLITYIYNAMFIGPHPTSILFLYLIGFYILLVSLKVNPWLGIAGAIAFAFSSYYFIIIEAGHNSKAIAIAFIPTVVTGVIMSFRRNLFLGGALTAFFLALEINANHLQITYYLFFILFIYVLFEFAGALKACPERSRRNKRLLPFCKTISVLAIACILAIGANISSIMMTYDYSKYTTRGKSDLNFDKENKTTGLDKDYATAWSYGMGETFTLLIPNFMGGPSQGEVGTDSETYKIFKQAGVPNARQIIKQLPMYWGMQPFTSGPVYVGAVICFLFVLGLFIIKGGLKWWLLSATILSIMLAWGKNFMPLTDLFLDYVPGYNKFRAVSMTLVIAEFTIPLLAILALSKVFDSNLSDASSLGGERSRTMRKSLKYSFFIVGGIAMLFVLLPSLFCDFIGMSDGQLETNGFPIEAIRADRASLLRSDAMRSFGFVLLTAGVLWLFTGRKLKKEYCYAVLILLVLIDLWPVNKRYLNNENFIAERKAVVPFLPTSADISILENELQVNPAIQKTIDGSVVALKSDKRKNRNQSPNITQEEMLDINFRALNENTNFRVFNLTVSTFNDASTSYYHKSIGGYHGAKLKRYQELIEFQISKNNMAVLNMLNTKYFIVKGKDNQPAAQTNTSALGNAWFVKNYELVANADSEITALSDFDPALTAIIDKRFEKHLEGLIPMYDASVSIVLTGYKPNHLVYQSSAFREQLAVFSEIYYEDGWNAYIDGEFTPHFRADYVLRAMRIPPGEHKIEFKFEPKMFAVYERVALAGSSLLLLLVIGIVFIELKKKFGL